MTGIAAAAVTASPPVLAVSVPDFCNGRAATAPVATGSAFASVSGGTPPYTYLWTKSGSSAETWTIGAPTSATTAFQCNEVSTGDTATAYFICTVHDAAAHVAVSNLLTANASAITFGGGGVPL